MREHRAEPYESRTCSSRIASGIGVRARQVFNVQGEWPAAQARYGNTDFGRSCFMARKLVEAGVPFVEVGQENYDSHADNFPCHKANMDVLDPAWSGLLTDLAERNLLADTLVVWMGEVGRTPYINNRAGRDHFIRAWTIVLAGGGGARRAALLAPVPIAMAAKSLDNPVSEGDLFADHLHGYRARRQPARPPLCRHTADLGDDAGRPLGRCGRVRWGSPCLV